MAQNRDVRVDLIGDSSSVQDAFRDAERSSDGLGKKLGGLGKFAAAGVAGVATGIGAGLVALGPQVFGAAAAMETLDAKAKTVFGDQLGTVQKWAKGNSAAMGLTSKEAVGLSAGFADLLIPMGFTRAAAAKMSTDVVGLSGALSQWSGGQKSAAEVSEILSAAMLGETDGLKSLGISIGAADIEARLLAKGQDKLTGAAKQQAEAQAIQALIMEKSTDAQTAYKNSSGTLLGQQQKLSAQTKELKDKAIGALIPLLLRGTKFVTGTVVPGFKQLRDGFAQGEGAGGRLRGTFDKLRAAFEANRPQIQQYLGGLKAVAGFIATRVVPLFVDFYVTKLSLAIRGLGLLVGAFNAIKGPALTVGGVIVGAFGKVVGAIGTVMGVLAKIPGPMQETFRKGAAAARAAAEDMAGVKRELEALAKPRTVKIGFVVNGINNLEGAAAKLERLDRGVGDGPGRRAGGNTLNRVKSMLGPGLSISSTYRSPARNAAIGGSRTSYHMDPNNPAVDVVGSPAALDRLYANLKGVGGWRELLWRVPGHYDHLHVAHKGGTVAPSWGTLPGLRADERPVIAQVGETILPRGVRPVAASAGGGDVVVMLDGQVLVRAVNALNGKRMSRGGTMPGMAYS